MNRNYTLVALLLCLLCNQLCAQQICGADAYLTDRLQNDPKFQALFKSYDKDKILDVQRSALVCNTSNSIVIPVAVHYNTPIDCSNQSCLLEAAEEQIAVLNECFSASNLDLSYYTTTLNGICATAYPSTRAPAVGDGSCIQFCLASTNHPTSSGLMDGEPAITIDQAVWPTAGADWSGYLNIFVSDGSTANQGSSTLGISALPGNADGDGFWVNYKNFGGPGFSCTSGATLNSSSSFDTGRTAVHEAGHYFGLYHVFQGSSCADNDSNPPGPIPVNDTPSQDTPHYGCPTVTSCSNAPSSCTGSYDNFYSFMDYSNDECMVMFTADQCKVLNHWAHALTWNDDTNTCGSITDLVNCDGPTCQDGIQNGTEIGIDCGGNNCVACTYTCGDTMTDNGGDQNYYDNEYTEWTVCSGSGDIVGLTFSEFAIEAGGSSGCYDKLELFDGNDTTASSMGVFCGNTLNDAPGNGYVESTGNCITLKFTSDASVNLLGWNLSITCGSASSCTDGIQNGAETGVDCGGDCAPCSEGCGEDFYDTGGTAGNYENGDFCTFLYCPDVTDEKIKATFTYADIESATGNGNNNSGCWDMLTVYDGDDDTVTMIGHYCGEESGDGGVPSQSDNNLYVGKEFISTHNTGCLYFVFESDNSVSETGWEADIECIVQSSTPVELIDFYGTVVNKDIQLIWNTASEINNEGFYVERKRENEVAFESIAFIKSVDLAYLINDYAFDDLNLTPGKYYYRLKQVDYNGTFEYSDVIALHIVESREYVFKASPNPAYDHVEIQFVPEENEQAIVLKIYTKLGVLLKEINIEDKSLKALHLDLSNYSVGTYVLFVETTKNNYVKRISKI